MSRAFDTLSALGTALLTLARTGAQGVLLVGHGSNTARMTLRSGKALEVADASLSPVSEVVAGPGGASMAARQRAVKIIQQLFRREKVSIHFRRCDVQKGSPPFEPCNIESLVIASARRRLWLVPRRELAAAVGDGQVFASPSQYAQIRRAPLWPWEQVALARMQEGTCLDKLCDSAEHAQSVLRFALCLKLLRLASPFSSGSRAYPLLLKKHRQVQSNMGWPTLLDVAPSAEASDVRRAMRRLVSKLHPDRFGDGSPATTRAAGEVVAALIRAAEQAQLACGRAS